jgi:NAD(P)-dependent dehydrogenase (short-subunit alcohol dehydrogenase family)
MAEEVVVITAASAGVGRAAARRFGWGAGGGVTVAGRARSQRRTAVGRLAGVGVDGTTSSFD